MHPKLITYPDISSYAALLLLGFLGGYLIARRLAVREGIEGRHVDNLTLTFLLVGLAGGRLFARLFYMPEISFWEAFKLWDGGGLVFYGGVIFCFLSVLIYCQISGLARLRLLDVFAPALAVGLGFGRIGCFLAGCCWGDVCMDASHLQKIAEPSVRYQISTISWASAPGFPLAVQFPPKSGPFKQQVRLGLIAADADRSLPVHPVQLYEAGMAFLLAAFLYRETRKQKKAGLVCCWFGLGYAVIRFTLEFLRGDNQPDYWGMTISQVISVIVGIFCLGILIKRHNESSGRYDFKEDSQSYRSDPMEQEAAAIRQ